MFVSQGYSLRLVSRKEYFSKIVQLVSWWKWNKEKIVMIFLCFFDGWLFHEPEFGILDVFFFIEASALVCLCYGPKSGIIII